MAAGTSGSSRFRVPRRARRSSGRRRPRTIPPDGRWLAYQSNKTGRYEVYVRPLPLSGTGEIAVTAEGGTRPVWARDGSELYYWTASRTSVAIKAIRITSGPPSSWGAPSVIVEGAYASTSFDTEYDEWEGRLLLMKDSTAEGVRPGREIVVVQNWLGELGRLVPVKQRREPRCHRRECVRTVESHGLHGQHRSGFVR